MGSRTVKMTGQERMNRMFARKDQDSVPRHESFWPETPGLFRDQGCSEDLKRFLGSDLQGVCWVDPMPFKEEQVLDRVGNVTLKRDHWGNTVRVFDDRSTTPEHVAFCIEQSEQWPAYKERLLARRPFVDVEKASDSYAAGKRSGLWTHFTGLDTFEMTRRVLGDETTLIGMLEEPEWIRDVSETMTTLVLQDFDLLWERGMRPDGVWIYGDMAYRRGPLCSPATYEELVWPDHKRMADWAHDHGLKFIFHTDGDVNTVLDLYEKAGFDCLQPLEAKAGMDITKIAPERGERLALFGNVDVRPMADNDLEAIEAEVRAKLAAGMATQGYVYHSDHSIPPSMTWESFRFLIDLVDRYGNYD